ncbi:glycosyltransferase [Halosegnis marinus]|uniref:Glycosyltransferase n=1 Tax=Halosegnis marinus TaxID=3034023 RepID=A0ABD5ZRC6_9EURY|nr:glycosyltransferase [Halosegnis sp. DT85]
MRVLNLVTNERARFYRQQVEALERRGVDCTTLAVPAAGDRDSRSVLDYAGFYLRAVRGAFGRFDVVHANYGLTGPPAVVQPEHPVVLSLWGTDLFGRYGAVSRCVARRSDAVIVMSGAMADALDTPCEVIPHGVDLSLFRPTDRDEAVATVGWDPDAVNVLFPYAKTHGVKDYPRAARLVDRANAGAERRIELHTVTGLPHDRVPTYMNAADALLLTSEHEGSPNVVKEAMGCRLPVVATDVGDVAERLAGVTPSTVSDDDADLVAALRDVAADPRRSDGREAVRDLSLERMAERIAAVYERVTG